RRVLPVLMILLTLGFCVVMMVYGWRAFEFALLLDERSASTLRVPQAYAVFLALPVGMALIIGRILLLMILRRGIVQTSEAGETTKAES
ncbi:MAG: TRAP transporter small permease subunit, partial [Oricola sp.]|nr:TRAP transporter small permease subunit [Oricola sp.]